MKKIGRNDPCPCGSGKKYKQCCDATVAAQNALSQPAQPASFNLNTKNVSPSSERLLQAVALHQAGKLDEAKAAYQSLLKSNPDDSDALHYLGLIAFQRGDYPDAAGLIEQAIKLNGTIPAFHFNLGNAYWKLEQFDSAINAYLEAVRLDPRFLKAHSSLGKAFKAQGDLESAAESYRKALVLKPDYAEAHNSLGLVLLAQGKLDEAVASYHRALALKPDYADAHNNLGLVFQAQGKIDAAAESYRKALVIEPDYAEAHNNLGNALKDQGKPNEAIELYRKALALRPDFAEAHNNLGDTLREEGLPDEAIMHYRKALTLKPDYAEAHVGLAYLNLDSGQFEAARAELSKALELKPEHSIAWAMLASLRKMTPDDSAWLNTALRLVSQGRLSEKETFNLQFAIGKYYDDTQQYDLAFSAYSQANRLKRQLEGAFDRAGFSRLVDRLIATYNADFIGQQREGASPSRRPVLIVGMPRSGTSLIEQIIASHPDAFGAGELTFWGQQVTANMAAILSGNYEPALIAKLATGYEHCLQRYSADATRVVDKMPDNFLRLGLIHTVFPKARIIHAQRNPVDTCVSIHFTNFSSGHFYSTDLEDLAFYYREYARLMRHWRDVLPADRFLEVPYEALVDDQAGWSRRIIEFTGLGWDERCLDFHKTERKVGTASNWQARQKIYRTSKARWRHYEKHLGPLLGLMDL